MSKSTKNINIFQGIGILVSTLLGSSIFIIPAMAASLAGDKSIIAWFLTIFCVLPVAATFGSLGAKYQNDGGTAYFIKKSFGDKFERFTSWLYLSALPICPPIIVITGASYLGAIWGANSFQLLSICLLMLGGLFAINLIGLKFAGKIQVVVSVIVVSILLTLIIAALLKVNLFNTLNLQPNFADISVMKTTIALLFWCFVGIEAVVHISGDFKNVERDFPLTIFISLFIVGAICILLSLIVLKFHAFGDESMNSNYIVYLFDILLGTSGKIFVAIMAFLTCISATNLYMISFAKMIHSMSLNGSISTKFSKVNKNQIPVNALIIGYGLVSLTVILKYTFDINLDSIILYTNTVFIAIYLLASIAGMVLLDGGKKYLSVISTLFCSIIFLSLGLKCLYIVALFLVFALVEYLVKAKSTAQI